MMPRGAPEQRQEQELEELRLRLAEAEQTLEAIRAGEVDSLVVEGPDGLRVYALEGASNTYRVLIEAMNEGAATLTESGVIAYCNTRLARLLELPIQRVMGSSLRERVSPRSQATLDALLRSAEHHESRGEVYLVSAGGEEIPAYLSLNTITAEARKIVCLVAVDLRPQRRTEELLASERLATSVIEQAAEATIVCDAAGLVIRASTSAAELCAGNPLLVPFGEAFPLALTGDGEDRLNVVAAVLGGETLRAQRGVLRHRDGFERELLVSAAPLYGPRGPTGEVIGCVITLVDVTEARHAEEALRESEERFRTLADNIPQLAWMANEEGSRFWYNRRWFEYTGLTPRDLAGAGWQQVHHPAHLRRVDESLHSCIQSGEAWENTFPLRRADGEHRWFLSRALPVRDARGRIVRWFGTNTDITSHRETEEALRRAVAVRDDFLSIASHELRTPITALGLQLEGLQRLARTGVISGVPRLAERLDTAVRQTERLGSLIEGLLDVSRIGSGRFPLELDTFELSELVGETIDRAGDMAARSGCEIRLHPNGDLVGTWDRSRLDQVLTNLLTNAVKYGSGKPIDVTLAEDHGDVVLCVEDRGIGISEADQERIFGRFERSVSSKHYGGLGLGLYITREIVEAHGGSIEVHSAPSRGSTFVVRLPRTPRANLRRPKASAPSP